MPCLTPCCCLLIFYIIVLQVSAYAAKMHALVEEGAKSKRSAGLSAFKSDLAEATARALGAK
jgi:hypothetical protein